MMMSISGNREKVIGIQIGAASFMDEEVEQVLDNVQKKGGVNTIFLTVYCYDRGLNGRQMPGHDFPDHGIRESDAGFYHGGNYATPHAKYYTKTAIKGDQLRAPDYDGVDVLAKVIPAARRRGIKIFAGILDSFDYPPDVMEKVGDFVEIDLNGKKQHALCFYKNDVREFWKALVTDLCSSYDIDGILFFNERNGPLTNTVGANFDVGFHDSRITCFCDDHKREAEKQGLNFERVKEGFRELDKLTQASLRGQRPDDGYYVAFERLLLNYPETIAYHQLFEKGKHQVLEDVYKSVKAVDPKMQMGFHIEHENSFNPFFRATRDYSDLATKADFLKIVAYNNAGGERYANFIRSIGSTMFRDVPLEELMSFNSRLLNYENQPALNDLPAAGLTPDYVFRETERAKAGSGGKCKILTGIDVNIAIKKTSRKASPEDTYAAVAAALRSSGDGIILSRKYSEMMLTNLEGAGNAVRDAEKG